MKAGLPFGFAAIFVVVCGLVLAGDIVPEARACDCRVVVYDWDGEERDLAWLWAKWGDVEVDCTGETWDVVILSEDLSGSITTVVALVGDDGYPLRGVQVTNSWLDGEIMEETNEEGRVYFPWGAGAYYQPPAGGPYTICTGGSCVSGLGWLWMSNHSHLNLIFWGEGPEEYRVFLPMVSNGAGGE